MSRTGQPFVTRVGCQVTVKHSACIGLVGPNDPLAGGRMKKLVRGLTVVLCVGVLGCGAGRREVNAFSDRGPQTVQLTVLNNRFEDATIHALWRGGAKRRVGVVT